MPSDDNAQDDGSAQPALGALIRDWRQRALLTQEELAERAGLNVRTVGRLEAGELRRPRSASVRSLAEALGLDAEELATLVRAADATPHRPRAERTPSPRADPAGRGGEAGLPLPVPRELPRDAVSFVGREAEIRRLADALTAERSTGICALAGPGGVGKSALAIHVAHRIADRFPDGQLYVDLHGATPDVRPLEPEEVLGRMLRSLGVPDAAIPGGVEEAAGRLRSSTDGKRLLLVLDNARDAAQVRPLLPGSRTCSVLITSRRVLAAFDGADHHRLGALSRDEAVSLLGGLIGRERAAAEPDAAARVAALCEGLPLAVCLAASRLVARPSWPVSALAERLAAEQHRLNELQLQDRAVRAGFQVGYRDLMGDPRGRAAARLFRLAGLMEGTDIGVAAAVALAGLPQEETQDLLDRLVDDQLMEEVVPGRYRTHDLLRLFAKERAAEEEPEQARTQAVRRALHHYLATARTATLIAVPSAGSVTELAPRTPGQPGTALATREDAHAWAAAEAGNLLAAVRQAARSADPALAVALAAAVDPLLRADGRWREQLTLFELAVGAARRTGDPRHLALTHGDLGWARLRLGRIDDAVTHLRESLTAYRRLGDLRGQANQLDGLANAYRILGRFEESLRYDTQALEFSRELGDRFGECAILTHLGLTCQRAGRLEEAIKTHAEAVDVARETGDALKTLIALGNLAEAQRLAGDAPRAAATFHEALAIGRSAGQNGTYWEAEHLWGLGRTAHDLGEPDRARRHWARSAAILHDLDLISADELRAVQAESVPEPPDIIRRNL